MYRNPDCYATTKDAIQWVCTPPTLNFLNHKDLRLGDKYIWEQVNRAIQLGMEITVGWLARMCGAGARCIQEGLARLVKTGFLLADPRPGKATLYSLPHKYLKKAVENDCGKPVENSSTPAQNVPPTPAQNVGGVPPPIKERARHNHEREIKERTNPSRETPNLPTSKPELIRQLEQRGVETRPHQFILKTATTNQLEQTIRRGDRYARRPGLYIHILRQLLGIVPKPPGSATQSHSNGMEKAGSILNRLGNFLIPDSRC